MPSSSEMYVEQPREGERVTNVRVGGYAVEFCRNGGAMSNRAASERRSWSLGVRFYFDLNRPSKRSQRLSAGH